MFLRDRGPWLLPLAALMVVTLAGCTGSERSAAACRRGRQVSVVLPVVSSDPTDTSTRATLSTKTVQVGDVLVVSRHAETHGLEPTDENPELIEAPDATAPLTGCGDWSFRASRTGVAELTSTLSQKRLGSDDVGLRVRVVEPG